MLLSNKLNKAEATKKIRSEHYDRLVLSFYEYVSIGNPKMLRDYLFFHWNEMGVLGRIYIAPEGINAQLSLPKPRLADFKKFIDEIPEFSQVHLNLANQHNNEAFLKLTIKVREKIVADGLDDGMIDLTKRGVQVTAKKFNEMLESDHSICVDVRNNYESNIGYFTGAITPDYSTFSTLLPQLKSILKQHKDKNILMYCTGGIRCEKASAYLLSQGFNHVFQLKGGIVEYYNQVKEKGLENKFLGKNFVFDNRLSESVSEKVISCCSQCGLSSCRYVNCANAQCNLLFIQCEACSRVFEQCCSNQCKRTKAIRKSQ